MSINPDPDSPFASPPGWFSGDTQMSELHLHSCLYRVHRKDSEKGVRLPKHQGEECTIDNRVTRVAWLNRSTILYAGNDKWCLDPRVVLLSNTQTQYSIEIQNVDVYDEGPYTCSVQTDNHPKTSRVHLIVQVSPKIVEISSDISINEGNNISLTCIATGRPEPTVTWRHISPKAVGFVSEDEYLEIQGITREQSGYYECSASNDVAAPVVRRVKVTVNYPPYISEAKGTGVPVGQKGTLQCEASAVPSAEFQWYKDDKRLVEGKKGVKVENRPFLSKLIFFNVSEHDYGNYTCVASNKLGHTNASITLFEVKTTTLPPGKGCRIPDGEEPPHRQHVSDGDQHRQGEHPCSKADTIPPNSDSRAEGDTNSREGNKECSGKTN
ncbi:hypothetical protein JEQ12_011069 [Ovis aries]|uniref:Ig-like domain-containing protein n=1 Tax=Ovis aries TaxID=9940 RepID=A0A835ZUJ0_SHEEP|nr:hypothetical protein JEQ12_011069 [Ovis aries]